MRFFNLAAVAVLLFTGRSGRADSFADVADHSLRFEPAQAKPGQVVTLKVTVTPKAGYWTYPANADQISRNRFVLPTTGDLIFVGPVTDPPGAKEKPGDNFGETDLYYPGPAPVTWAFTAVVSPGRDGRPQTGDAHGDATPGLQGQVPEPDRPAGRTRRASRRGRGRAGPVQVRC